MSLPRIRKQRTMFESDQVLGRLVEAAPQGAERFVFFAERVWPELMKLRPKLETMYCAENGRPAEEPVRMVGVVLLQFMERLPDRQAAEACTWDGRWKLALRMEVDERGFHATTLVKFRNRLVAHGMEGVGFEGVLEAMGQEKPDELYVDAGYTSGSELARADAEGWKLKGPMQPAPVKEGWVSSEAFKVNVEERRAECPAGQKSTNCSRLEEQTTGAVMYRFEWNKRLCRACELRVQCVGKRQSHRTLVVGGHHDRIQARRQEQKTEAFRADMHHRNGIEGTISELARGHGLRRCRYRGLAKARLQNWFIGAACNVKRWCRRQAWELHTAAGSMSPEYPTAVAA